MSDGAALRKRYEKILERLDKMQITMNKIESRQTYWLDKMTSRQMDAKTKEGGPWTEMIQAISPLLMKLIEREAEGPTVKVIPPPEDYKDLAARLEANITTSQKIIHNIHADLSALEARVEGLEPNDVKPTLTQVAIQHLRTDLDDQRRLTEQQIALLERKIQEINKIKQGPRGEQGPRGPIGMTGMQGPAGPPGTPVDVSRVMGKISVMESRLDELEQAARKAAMD